MTLVGMMTGSCNKQPGKKKGNLLEIDFVGPENYFPIFHSACKKNKGTSLHFKTLEQALFTVADGAIVLLPAIQKASVILMLLEMDKDILTPYPLAKDFMEFDAIQKQCNVSNRRIAILDPLRYWEPVLYITDLLQGMIGSVRRVELIINSGEVEQNIHSANIHSGNITGMIRLISCILGMNPSGLTVKNSGHQDILKTKMAPDLEIGYNGISLFCRNDSNVNGWVLEFSGEDFYLSLNSDGYVNSEGFDKGMDKEKGKNGITWDKDFKRKAFNKNINDFITTIRTRKEPEINSLDGMAGIAFNLAVLESAKSGKIISLMVE